MTSIFTHYNKLLYFALNRFKGENYLKMQEYFAGVMVRDLEKHIDLYNKDVLDVGSQSGQYCLTLSNIRKCRATALDPHPKNVVWRNIVQASADQMPFPDKSFDLILFRGVIEHIPPDRWKGSIREIYRCLRSGGVLYLVMPPWYCFHAGHQLKPFHYFPFAIAKKLRRIFFGNKVEGRSYADINLYPITFSQTEKLLLNNNFSVVKTLDTHFRLHRLCYLPLLREILIPAVAFIAKKND